MRNRRFLTMTIAVVLLGLGISTAGPGPSVTEKPKTVDLANLKQHPSKPKGSSKPKKPEPSKAPDVAAAPTPPPAEVPAPVYTPPQPAPVAAAPSLYDYAAQLGLSLPGDLTLVLTNDMPAGDDAVAGSTIYGVYYGSTNTIYVRDGLTGYQTKNILAYEYMHYVYYRVAPIYDRFQMGGEVLQMWNTQPTMMRYAAQLVPVNDSEKVDEGISIMCTRMATSEISEFANNYCNTYIPNRWMVL